MKKIFYFILVFFLPVIPIGAAEQTPIELEGIGITEHLGEKISLDTPFVDETGQDVTLKKYFDDKLPVIIFFIYYDCPNLCNLLLDGFVNGLKEFQWTIGKEFRVVTISMQPKDLPKDALATKEGVSKVYSKPINDWHFLTGTEDNIRKVTSEIGFQYRWDDRQNQYAHTAAIYLLTPGGKISRYLYGITFSSNNLKLGLVEAGEGKIGTLIDRFLLFCYHYDPEARGYQLMARKLMRIAGAVTVVTLILFLWRLSGKKRKLV